MKLYYTPGVCSLSPHIVLREAGYDFELIRVDLKRRRTQDGRDLESIHAKSYVPILELDDGSILTEGPAIVQYLADQRPSANLIAPAGTFARYRQMEWLNYISAELHKPFYPFFHQEVAGSEWLRWSRSKLEQQIAWVDSQLRATQFLFGDTFTVVDAYLATVLTWTPPPVGIEVTQWTHVARYMGNVVSRPAVRQAFAAEGLNAQLWLARVA